MKEIDWRLRAISKRLNDERKFQISVHGGEIKEEGSGLKLDKKQEDLISKFHSARMQNGKRQNSS